MELSFISFAKWLIWRSGSISWCACLDRRPPNWRPAGEAARGRRDEAWRSWVHFRRQPACMPCSPDDPEHHFRAQLPRLGGQKGGEAASRAEEGSGRQCTCPGGQGPGADLRDPTGHSKPSSLEPVTLGKMVELLLHVLVLVPTILVARGFAFCEMLLCTALDLNASGVGMFPEYVQILTYPIADRLRSDHQD